jgi:hypothetical protein
MCGLYHMKLPRTRDKSNLRSGATGIHVLTTKGPTVKKSHLLNGGLEIFFKMLVIHSKAPRDPQKLI